MDAVKQPEPHNSAPSGGAGAPIAAALWRSIDHRFLAVPEIDDEDRLGAGVIHPDDLHGGASSRGQRHCWGRPPLSRSGRLRRSVLA